MTREPSPLPESERITPAERFLAALKPVPEYRGPEYWYRALAALAEERSEGVS